MKSNTGLMLVMAASLILITVSFGLSEEQSSMQQEPATVTSVQNEPETQWVWGEVVNLDTENKVMVVKYLDYETDQEKEISIGVDDKTTYENVKSLDEVKPQDAVSIDYTLSPDGKNIAKNISLEKPETQPVPAPGNTGIANPEAATQGNAGAAVETAPEQVQPVTPQGQ
jgi:hypothetical protein